MSSGAYAAFQVCGRRYRRYIDQVHTGLASKVTVCSAHGHVQQ